MVGRLGVYFPKFDFDSKIYVILLSCLSTCVLKKTVLVSTPIAQVAFLSYVVFSPTL